MSTMGVEDYEAFKAEQEQTEAAVVDSNQEGNSLGEDNVSDEQAK